MRHIATAATALALTLGMIGAAQAEDGKLLVRARMIKVTPNNDGGSASVGGKPSVGADTVPEVDATYFFTPNVAAELIAGTTEHSVRVMNRPAGLDLGKVKLLPPTLTAQYHFTGMKCFKPYVGAGITYAHFYDAEHPGYGSVKYDDNWGAALQAGVDYKLTDKIYLNADVKKIMVKTNVTVNDSITAKANLNPTVIGLGAGYRF